MTGVSEAAGLPAVTEVTQPKLHLEMSRGTPNHVTEPPQHYQPYCCLLVRLLFQAQG